MSNEGMKRFGLAARAELMQLNEQLERKVKELGVLFEIGKSVTSLSNLEKLLSRIVEAAVYITGAEEGALLLLDEATGDLYMRAQRGLNERYASEFKLKVEDTIAGSVVKTGQPVMLDMSQANESFKMKTRYFVKSLLIVPLKVGEEVIGVLSADNQLSNRPFTEHNLNMLSALADYAAIAIENARLLQDRQRKVEELDMLYEIQHAITTSTDLSQALLKIAESANEVIEADLSCIYRYDETEDQLYPPVIAGHLESSAQPNLTPSPDGATAKLVREGSFVVESAGLLEDELRSEFVRQERVKSFAGFALRAQNSVVGVMWVDFRTFHQFTDEELKTLERLASQVTIAIQNAKRYKALERTGEAARDLKAVCATVDSPIAAIPAVVEEMKSDVGEDEALERYLRRLEDEVRWLPQMAEELRQLAESEGGEPANVNRLLFMALDRVTVSEKVKVVKDCAADLPPFMVFREGLIDVFAALITNAMEAMTPGGGTLTLCSRLSDDEEWVEIEVIDTGCGLTPDMQRRVFDLFFTTKEKKTSFGLWWYRAFVRGLGGDISVRSEVGKGSAFTIRLPAS